MAWRVFTSFHFGYDYDRARQVRRLPELAPNRLAGWRRWEAIKAQGEAAIAAWIDAGLAECDILLVLIGEKTATRKWVKYEIAQAAKAGKPIIGLHIHQLRGRDGFTGRKGRNPLQDISPSAQLVYNTLTVAHPGAGSLRSPGDLQSSSDQLVQAIEALPPPPSPRRHAR